MAGTTTPPLTKAPTGDTRKGQRGESKSEKELCAPKVLSREQFE